jgi:hypothetical protein
MLVFVYPFVFYFYKFVIRNAHARATGVILTNACKEEKVFCCNVSCPINFKLNDRSILFIITLFF